MLCSLSAEHRWTQTPARLLKLWNHLWFVWDLILATGLLVEFLKPAYRKCYQSPSRVSYEYPNLPCCSCFASTLSRETPEQPSSEVKRSFQSSSVYLCTDSRQSPRKCGRYQGIVPFHDKRKKEHCASCFISERWKEGSPLVLKAVSNTFLLIFNLVYKLWSQMS